MKQWRNVLSKGRVDTTLGSDSVTSGGEELRDTGSVESSLRETESGTQTGTTGTDDDGIVLVILIPVSTNLRCSFSMPTYNNRVLLGDVASGLLGAERLVAEDTGCREQLESAEGIICKLNCVPAGREEEKRRL